MAARPNATAYHEWQLLTSYKHAAGEAAKAALLEQLREELHDSGEFSFISRAAAQALGVGP